eukprot:maker-scaffold67_size430214-snap-gene-1.20 protein:Tk00776 transcript:maker-scaffold67_size430214-snap-gene-1.20-mRNA-1 annotation:"retinol dehydrogenase 12-like isoform x2"
MIIPAVVYTFQVLLKISLLPWLLWVYKELSMGICSSKKRLTGKVVLITGGNAGIGFETALDAAQRGAEVIIASRNMTKTLDACNQIKRKTGNANVHAKLLDLSTQKDVQRFAGEILAEFPQIHYLVNNAGMVGDIMHTRSPNPKYGDAFKVTPDGHELIMATNFLGPTTLTELLLERVKASGILESPSRIIHVSSMANMQGSINPDLMDLSSRKRPFIAVEQYNNSKLMQLHYNCDLARRLKGSHCESVALHPGVVRTEINRDILDKYKRMLTAMFYLIGKNCWQGAQTTIFSIVAEESLNGKYLADCRPNRWMVNSTVGDESREVRLIKEVKNLLNLK